ncbi:DUF4435 domain-containing protein [Providencia rettgeri]|uniref:DUF4435 domain-containing protein n=1 Tax=Providencia rettgeri TaxID=587 RepID=UPI00235F660C|nr:DUF4435 domain-containing protein [Providencia rettgeri]
MTNTISEDDILDLLNKAKLSRSALKQEILTLKSESDIVLIFEGVTDFPAYDEWLKHEESYTDCIHICAKGKKQVLELYLHSLAINDDEILDSCKFFVDHDYDLVCHNDRNIVTLNCYSIENYIVNRNSVKNYLMDEFRLDMRHRVKLNEVVNTFIADYNNFLQICNDICKPLFVNYNSLEKVKFIEKISHYINIEYNNIRLKKASEYGYLVPLDSDKTVELMSVFDELPLNRTVRGKYVLEFIKQWLSSAKLALANYMDQHNLSIKNDPLTLTIRRLASSSPKPTELNLII